MNAARNALTRIHRGPCEKPDLPSVHSVGTTMWTTVDTVAVSGSVTGWKRKCPQSFTVHAQVGTQWPDLRSARAEQVRRRDIHSIHTRDDDDEFYLSR